MEPLKLNREILKLFDMRALDYPAKNISLNIRRRNQIILFTLLIFLVYGLLSSIDFIIKVIETDLESALFALFQVCGMIISTYAAIITSLFPHAVRNFSIKLNNIRENGILIQSQIR